MLQGGFSGISLTPDLARLVGHLNRYVWGRSEPNRFATAFVGVLDEDGRLEYINAGHLPALLVRASGATIQLASDSLPIGVFPDTTFTSRQMTLAVGDTLVVFTDGVTEATNTADEEFGMARLTSLLAAHANGTVGESQDAVLAAVGRFSEGREQDDDMTLLVVRYIGVRSGTDPHRSPGAGGQRGGASASE
jgi:sigma-B regulation protein RsbU (phosphoserine phosphatase)